jgi:hypothetical protein
MAAKSTVAAAAKIISKPRRFTPRRAALTLVRFTLHLNDLMFNVKIKRNKNALKIILRLWFLFHIIINYFIILSNKQQSDGKIHLLILS